MKNASNVEAQPAAARLPLLITLFAVCLAVPSLAGAGTFVKTNSLASLNTAAAWTNNAVPGAADIAQWDSTAAGTTTNALGANSSWSGIRILNPGAPVLISVGSTLTNGAAGIDMSAASSDFSMSNAVAIQGLVHQTWTVAPGRTLATLAIPNRSGTLGLPGNTGIATFGTTGTIRLGAATSALLTDNQVNPWATYGPGDWAALDVSGNVIAATYTEASTGISGNLDVDANAATGTGSVSVNSVRFNASSPTVLSINNGATFTARGILVTPNCGGAMITNSGASGFMRVNRGSVAATPFTIIQNSANDLTIATTISTISSGTATVGILVAKYGPGNVNLTGQNSYVNGTFVMEGRLTVGAGAGLGSGGVTVTNSQVIINATNTTGVPGLVINNGGTNTINVNYPNGQLTCLPVTFNAGATRFQFNYKGGVGMSTTTPPLLVSNLTANGAITLDILSGNPAVGTFPLVKYTNSFSGAGFSAFSLGVLPLRTSGYLSNDVASASIYLVVTNISEPLKWATGSGTWDIATTANWQDTTGASTTYQQANGFGDSVLFEDTVSGASPITVTLNANPVPGAVTVNATKNYTITGNGGINGGAVFTKSGSGTLVLGTTNAFGGGLNLNGGLVNFNTISNLGGGSITFNGGTLQYNGNTDDISTRPVTLAAGGGTIDTAGQSVNYAGPIGNSGAGSLTKTGNGTLTLNDTNNYSGNTLINAGTLQIGGGNTFIPNTHAFVISSGAVLDASPIGNLILNGQTLAGSGSVNGSLTAANNSVITPGTNGVFATLTFNNDLTFNGAALQGGTLVMDVATTNSDLVAINGALNLNNANAGTVQINNVNLLTNGVYKLMTANNGINGSIGSLTLNFTQANKSGSLVVNGSEVDLVVATTGNSTNVWAGDGGNNYWDIDGSANWLTNGIAGAYFDNGDAVIFDDTSANTSVNIVAPMSPRSVVLNVTNNNYNFQDGSGIGSGKISGAATTVTINGAPANTVTFSVPNNYGGPTTINGGGTLQVGNGATGDIGTGNITNNGSALVFSQGDGNIHNVVGQISGTGTLTQQGSVTLVLQTNNTYTGATTISAGMLQIGNGGSGGTLGTAGVVDNAALAIDRAGAYNLNNAISGSGVLIANGPGTVTLSGANTYLNNTYITNGTVKLGAAEEIPDANTVPGSTGWLILDGGTTAGIFDLNGFNETINSLSGLGGTINGVITNSGVSATTTNVLTILENAGTTYNGLINENPAGSKVQVILLGNTELRFNGNSPYSGGTLVGSTATLGVGAGGTLGTGSITMSNGATLNMHAAGSSSAFVGNQVIIPAASIGQFNSSSQGNGFGGLVFGGPTATNQIIGPVSFSAGNSMQYNNFSGTVVITSAGALRFSASSGLNNGGTNTLFDVEGNLFARNGGTITLGGLEGAGSIGAPSTLGTATYAIGSLNTDTTFSGPINNNLPSTNNAITKIGTGRLTLSGTLSYLGNTVVSNGVLAIVDPASFDNSPNIILGGSTAVIDVSGRGDDTLNFGNLVPQILAGNGTIRGSLFEAATTTNNLTLGTLTVTNVATINGALTMQINRTNTPNSAKLSALSFVNGGSIVFTVTNVGPTNLVAGDTFQLFNQAFPGTFVVTNLPPLPSAFVYWTNMISLNGSIAIGSLVNPNPTNITFSVSGTTLSLSWPADHTGWTLQTQTNSLSVGLGTNWVDVPGSTSINSTNIILNPTIPTAFYRLRL